MQPKTRAKLNAGQNALGRNVDVLADGNAQLEALGGTSMPETEPGMAVYNNPQALG